MKQFLNVEIFMGFSYFFHKSNDNKNKHLSDSDINKPTETRKAQINKHTQDVTGNSLCCNHRVKEFRFSRILVK